MPIWHSLYCPICQRAKMFKFIPKHPIEGISYWECEDCHHKIRYDKKDEYIIDSDKKDTFLEGWI